MKLHDLALVLGVVLPMSTSASFALADGKGNSNPWALAKRPSAGDARPIGQYTSGCLQGAAQLPLDGPGYQVMHPSRLRYFGHPQLVAFIQNLGAALRAASLGDLMVGDLSQPRGGPAPGGHSSHQTGLDVDLWFWLPEPAAERTLTQQERETIKARSVLDGKTSSIRAQWSSRVLSLLRLTADDARVERIFVNPVIKRDACKSAKGDRTWLRKLRPGYGHDDHFHVRLECPASAKDCVAQTPTARGDGCQELDWWFSPEASADRKKGRATYQAKVGKAPGMPAECRALLAKPAKARAADVEPAASPLRAADAAAQNAAESPPAEAAASLGASL